MILHPTIQIDQGESQSTVIDLTGMQIVGIFMPDDWTAADLTLLSAPTADGPWVPVHEADGTEHTIDGAADRAVLLAPDTYKGIRFLKLRSGTAAAAVNQAADRIITLAVASTA